MINRVNEQQRTGDDDGTTGGRENEHKSPQKRFLICCARRIIVFCCFCICRRWEAEEKRRGGSLKDLSGGKQLKSVPLCPRCKRRTLLFFSTIHRSRCVCQPILFIYQCMRLYMHIIYVYIGSFTPVMARRP